MNNIFKFINKIRFLVYGIGIIVLLIYGCTPCFAEMHNIFSKKKKDHGKDRKEFWPPDLIPHPHLPQPERPPREGRPCVR